MAWYSIDHECGHTERHQIPGSNSGGQRDRRADLMRHTECSACAAEARQADRQSRDAAAAEQGLPDLVGTPRQVSWATTIRAEALAVLDMVIDYLDSHGDRPADRDKQLRQTIADTRAIYLATVEAKKWIHYRTYQHDPIQLARVLATAAQRAELDQAEGGSIRDLRLTITLARSRNNRLLRED
ncbi:hypothetical protein ACFZC5_26680 [Nocardia gamkensis]|uniref:hypothetical protein n=1 Tax=Nocardia gamkensis TaxID=352869 RepID=UPI0036E7CF70